MYCPKVRAEALMGAALYRAKCLVMCLEVLIDIHDLHMTDLDISTINPTGTQCTKIFLIGSTF